MSASTPMAMLSLPVVSLASALSPRAVLSFVKQPSTQVARACGPSARHVRARAMTRKPRCKGERYIEFVAGEVLAFIKQTFLFPRRVNSAIVGLNEGKEAVGRSALSRIQVLVSVLFAKNLANLASQFGARANRRFEFHKRSQHFIGTNDETLSVAVRVHNPDRAPFNIES